MSTSKLFACHPHSFHLFDACFFSTLETALEKHVNVPALAPTYNPHLLGRTAHLAADISHLLAVPENEWTAHPIHTDLLTNPPVQLTSYTTRLRTLSDAQPSLLLAHSYVRYLGDLSGGQVIRRRIAKAYGLDVDADSGSGVDFYTFGSLEGARVGNSGDLLKVKVWFRDGMDAGVGSDEELKREYFGSPLHV
jgi:heme oxygenase (biliverdin-producing, ferredoxin)